LEERLALIQINAAKATTAATTTKYMRDVCSAEASFRQSAAWARARKRVGSASDREDPIAALPSAMRSFRCDRLSLLSNDQLMGQVRYAVGLMLLLDDPREERPGGFYRDELMR